MADRLTLQKLLKYFSPPGKEVSPETRHELTMNKSWGDKKMAVHVVTVNTRPPDLRKRRFAFVRNVKDKRNGEPGNGNGGTFGVPTRRARKEDVKTILEVAGSCVREELEILEFREPKLLSIRENGMGIFHAIFWTEADFPGRISRKIRDQRKTAVEAVFLNPFSLPIIRSERGLSSKIMGRPVYPSHLGMISLFIKTRSDTAFAAT